MSLGVSPGFFFATVCSDCGWPPFFVKKTGWQFDGWHLPLCGGEYGGGDYRWGTGDPIEIRIQASSFPWSCATNLKRSGLLLMSMDGRMSGSWLTASIGRPYTWHILKLRKAFPGQSIFGRSDVMSVIEIKSSRASDLLKDMAEHGIIEPVTGHGKGKYRFIKQQDWAGGDPPSMRRWSI